MVTEHILIFYPPLIYIKSILRLIWLPSKFVRYLTLVQKSLLKYEHCILHPRRVAKEESAGDEEILAACQQGSRTEGAASPPDLPSLHWDPPCCLRVPAGGDQVVQRAWADLHAWACLGEALGAYQRASLDSCQPGQLHVAAPPSGALCYCCSVLAPGEVIYQKSLRNIQILQLSVTNQI